MARLSQGGEADSLIQTRGRAIMTALYSAAQSLKIYPFENTTVQNALDELQRVVTAVTAAEGALELRLAGDFVFMNDVRLRFDLGSYATVSFVGKMMMRHGVGGVEVEPGVERDEWGPFLSLLLRDPSPPDPFEALLGRLRASPVQHIIVSPETEKVELLTEEEAKQAAKRTYFEAVQVAQEVLTDVRLGKAVKVRRVKRAVQSIVDQVISNQTSILGMTTLRDYDEYTFTHSVNVCILSVVIGQKLGLSKLQLYELGLGALFHDIGKMRIDPEVTKKTSGLNDAEWKEMQQHPTEGLLALFSMHGFSELPLRAMLMAYEHHMKVDLTGYPRNKRQRHPTLFSRVVAVADGFDAATSKRSYQSVPWPPDKVLQEMRDNPKRGYDPLLVKTLINVMGVYPVGTVVILDTRELAVVVATNSNPRKLHQPHVRIIYDELGMHLAEPTAVDLSEVDPRSGRARRAIVKTTDAERYGIRVSDYFV